MHHIAIMNKSWRLIPKILSGEKTIESRWYQTRRAPWNRIAVGDEVFFKNSGEPIIARSIVSKVLQFEPKTNDDLQNIVDTYGNAICLLNRNAKVWSKKPKYCILVFLDNPEEIEPFYINKKGFGISNAWIALPDIAAIKV